MHVLTDTKFSSYCARCKWRRSWWYTGNSSCLLFRHQLAQFGGWRIKNLLLDLTCFNLKLKTEPLIPPNTSTLQSSQPVKFGLVCQVFQWSVDGNVIFLRCKTNSNRVRTRRGNQLLCLKEVLKKSGEDRFCHQSSVVKNVQSVWGYVIRNISSMSVESVGILLFNILWLLIKNMELPRWSYQELLINFNGKKKWKKLKLPSLQRQKAMFFFSLDYLHVSVRLGNTNFLFLFSKKM